MSKLRLSSLILIFSFMASPFMPESIRLIDTVSAQEEKKKKRRKIPALFLGLIRIDFLEISIHIPLF